MINLSTLSLNEALVKGGIVDVDDTQRLARLLSRKGLGTLEGWARFNALKGRASAIIEAFITPRVMARCEALCGPDSITRQGMEALLAVEEARSIPVLLGGQMDDLSMTLARTLAAQGHATHVPVYGDNGEIIGVAPFSCR